MFKIGGLAAAGLGGAALLGACSPAGNEAGAAATETATTGTTTVAGHTREGLPSFLAAPEPITDVADTKDFDIVIVGAGAAGVPAAITAREAGATVALIQKEATAISQGNTATGILLDTSDEAGVEAVVSRLLKDHQYRGKREQVELWAKNSGEAVKWMLDLATAEGAQVSDTTMKWTAAIKEVNGYPVDYLSIDFGPKPYNTGDGMQVLADYAAAQGVEIFYNTEAKQLVGDAAGVTGVIAEGPDGIVQFNASKGVILATGDYQNDDDMMAYYLPDLANLGRKQMNKTGDGHKMAVWAGGAIEDITHTKMLHDFDGGPGSMADMPFLAVKTDGTRFCDETLGMSLMNNFLRSEADQGDYNQTFDSNYMTAAAEWPGKLFDPEAIKVYMPEEDVEKVGVFEDQIGTYKADTLEELASKLGITDTAAFVKSVERYNECVAAGKDLDFGKEGKWLTAIDTPPFYGIHRHVRVSAVVSGVNVGPNMEVLAAETGEPIPGLFAIGNTAGNFYGGVDYSMYMPGLSLGRAHTQGYVTGKYVASL
ncbi:FAD-binding protein [Adlercreutzia muris]|uniref:FAD-binding protein n=1 Tax=Adlercreutzia muris TaxID=1796610 RepID=UPI00351941E1